MLQNQRVALEGAYDVAEVRMKTKKIYVDMVKCFVWLYVLFIFIFCVSGYDVGPVPIPLRRFDHSKPMTI